ncbi:MAG: DUF6206 family protein [bacterium]
MKSVLTVKLPDSKFLLEFENQLDPAYPEKSKIPVNILGYGEISSVFEIGRIGNLAFKRMPPFDSLATLEAYRAVLEEYCELLRSLGIRLVPYSFFDCRNNDGEHILYIVQPKLDAARIGHRYLQQCSEKKMQTALSSLFLALCKIWRYNRENGDKLLLGLDAQISNWIFEDGKTTPAFLDYSTPFLRKDGRDMLNTEIFLKSMPFYLIHIVRRFFLQEILDRYYDLRQVLIDLIANFYKEGLAGKISAAIHHINNLSKHEAPDLHIAPLAEAEIENYYRSDALMWKLLLNFRRFDRFLKTKILQQKYNFILPGKIDR